MPSDRIFEGFDEGTKVKLHLFHQYIRQWLPTLIHNNFSETLNIFDFFAGAGVDEAGNHGSPLLTLNAIEEYISDLKGNGVKLNLYLNDNDPEKIESLKGVVEERMTDALRSVISYEITCKDFESIFDEYLPLMKRSNVANFLFLDQYGIDKVTEPVFSEIIGLKTTDFMFFITSETFNRFGHVGRTQHHLNISPEEIMATQHNNIHRTVTDHYKGLIPDGHNFYLAPFSIKKPDTGNIYGLVFGSGHLAGLQKFMNVAWGLDTEFGEANYDVDGENIERGQTYFFDDMQKPTKKELFHEKLTQAFEQKAIVTDLELLEFALTNGFEGRHAREVLPDLHARNILPRQSISLTFRGSRWTEPNPIEYN